MARYYDNANQAQRFQPGTTVRADEVDGKFDSVASGFSDVETDVDRSLKLVADGSNHEVSATASQRRNRVVGFDANGDLALLRGFSWRGDYASGTEYFVNDVFRDPATKNLYVVEVRHTASSSIDASKTDLAINVADVEAAKDAAKASEDEAEDWASKTNGLIDSSDYSAKAYAVGGLGVDGVIGSAKDWAIKTDATVDGTDYSAKYWATDTNVTTVASGIGDIQTVAGDIADVSTVAAEIGAGKDVTVVSADLTGANTIGTAASDIANINTVATDIASINTVAGGLGAGQDVTVVAADLSGTDTIGTVAGSIADVNTVAGEIGAGQDVTLVAANIADVGTVATDIANVNTTATNIANVNTTASISAEVTTVADISGDVSTVSGISTNVTAVANNNANVTTVASNIADVNTVAGDISDIIDVANDLNEAVSEIEVVANNIADVNTVGTNIADVNTVAGISGDVSTVAGDSADIQLLADNIGDINAKVNKTGDTMTGDLIFDTTGALTLPDGTEAQRPTPAQGMVRFNTDSTQFEGYNGTAWGSLGGGAKGGAELVATGSIPGSGTPVALLSDGTVEAVSEIAITDDLGTENVFNSGDTKTISATYDSSAGKVVIAYQDDVGNNSNGTAVVGTVSGSSISFGSPTVFSSNNAYETSIVYDSAAGKVVIAYNDDFSNGSAVVGTVSGSSISFGSPTIFNSGKVAFPGATYDSAAGKVVIAYEDSSNSGFGTAVVGTVSGDSISFGSPSVFKSAETFGPTPVYDSAADKVVIIYPDDTNSSSGTAVVGTVSGDSISFGSEVIFNSGATFSISAVYEPDAGKIVIAYTNYGDLKQGTAVVGTVSGDNISFGSPIVFASDETFTTSTTYDSANGKVVIAYRNGSNSFFGTLVAGAVSGDSISFGSPIVYNSGQTDYIFAAYHDDAERVVIAYQDTANSDFGTAITYSPLGTSSNANDFIGFAQDAASNGETVIVATNQQIDANQTGLTPKLEHYLNTDGTLTTSDTGFPAGFALNTNTIRTGG